MISTPETLQARRVAEVQTAQPRRIWGLTPTDLCDRYWAARGVQVVRPGTRIERRGPVLYLLCHADTFLLFELRPVIRELNRLKPRLLRLRVADDRQQSYREVVESEGDDRFVAIRRHYRVSQRQCARAWITHDREIAQRWSDASDGLEASREIKSEAGMRLVSLSCSGRVFKATEARDAGRFLEMIQERWRNPGAMVDGVFEYQPGVWIHERAQVPRGVRFAGPVWVGAGVELSSTQIVVGPIQLPDSPRLSLEPGPVTWDLPVLSHYRATPIVGRGRVTLAAKRGFDIAFSLAVLAATLPLYPLIILAIWLEDGWPPFFAHTRQTRGGRPFPCYKFRTMYRNAEQLKAQLAAANVCDGPQFYVANDPRVLKVGKILRKLQLDELPQFWNVLLGHMSVVGPRPSPDRENQFCPTWREARLSVRPGVTGLWQVSRTRTPETDFQEWIRYDLEYVQHASWRLDLWIIMQTIRRILSGR